MAQMVMAVCFSVSVEAVGASVAYVEGVQVVPAEGGAGGVLPAHVVVFAQNDAGPVGEIASAAAFALDVVVDAASIGVLLPDV